MDLVTQFNGCGLFRVGEEAVVFLAVEQGLLRFEEVGREEDVGADSREEGAEFWRGCGREGWDGASRSVSG